MHVLRAGHRQLGYMGIEQLQGVNRTIPLPLATGVYKLVQMTGFCDQEYSSVS